MLDQVEATLFARPALTTKEVMASHPNLRYSDVYRMLGLLLRDGRVLKSEGPHGRLLWSAAHQPIEVPEP